MSEQRDHQEMDISVAAEEVMAAIREFHEQGSIDDVFGRLPDETPLRPTEGASGSKPLRYSIVIEWASEDQVFVVSLPEWGDLIHTHGATHEEALQRGDPLPQPRTFVGI